MKIAITTTGMKWSSPMDPRFGRAHFVALIDTETEAFMVFDNSPNLNAPQGAGIQTGKRVVDLDVDVVITGHVGPKAFATLEAGNVKVYRATEGTVADVLKQFKEQQLAPLVQADVEGHW